jgi:hypothetical protein
MLCHCATSESETHMIYASYEITSAYIYNYIINSNKIFERHPMKKIQYLYPQQYLIDHLYVIGYMSVTLAK